MSCGALNEMMELRNSASDGVFQASGIWSHKQHPFPKPCFMIILLPNSMDELYILPKEQYDFPDTFQLMIEKYAHDLHNMLYFINEFILYECITINKTF